VAAAVAKHGGFAALLAFSHDVFTSNGV
jgi:hypothetical protein